MRRQVVQWKPEQRATRDRPQLRLKDRVAVLLILFQVNIRLLPRLDPGAERCGICAEPDKTLDLLKLEHTPLLFELLDVRRMVRSHELRELLRVRRRLSEK